MRTLTAYWIGVVIVLALLNGIRALPAGSRARRFMWNMGIAAGVIAALAIALKSGSRDANLPSIRDAHQINSGSTPASPEPTAGIDRRETETGTSIVVPNDIIQVQSRLIDLGYMLGPPDGLWGSKSRQALRSFKAANGIQADDKWDFEISARLFSTQAVRSPSPLAATKTSHTTQ